MTFREGDNKKKECQTLWRLISVILYLILTRKLKEGWNVMRPLTRYMVVKRIEGKGCLTYQYR